MEWIKNGPDVEKPSGKALLLTTGKYWGEYLVATWHKEKSLWFDISATDDYWRDEEISHFAIITEPTDAQA